jgi:Cft2 family RNA processing exonuclease
VAAAAFPALVRPAGLYLPELDLYVDPSDAVERAFVSHAHAYRCAGSRTVLASRETALLLGALGTDVSGVVGLEWSKPAEVSWTSARLSVEPAGHLFGAAQLVVEHDGRTCVYAGDWCPAPGRTHGPGKAVACDELLLPCAFGLPIFRFPDRAGTLRDLVGFCKQTLGEQRTPVLLVQPLGEGQEVARALLDDGLDLAVDDEVARGAEAYEKVGIPLGVAEGRTQKLDAKTHTRVVLAATSAHRSARKIRGARVALVSGMALLDAAMEQRRADAAFVYSELADHDELVAVARGTGASHVTTTHGHASVFASVLRDGRIAATALELPTLDSGARE